MTTPVLVEIDDTTVEVTVATESVVVEGVGAVGPPGATGATGAVGAPGADSTVPGPQGEPGEPGTTLHAELTDTTADDHHDQDHAARHATAGADPVAPAAIGAEPAGTVATHSADTTSVHGIADTALLATQSELDTHAADTTSVHGIADTSALALTSHDHDGDYDALGAATAAAAALVDSSPSTLDTLNELAAALGDDPNFATTVTTALGTKATTAALAAHEADTTAIHGITDTSALETTTGSAAKVAAHESDTSVHGIADTTVLATDAEVTAAVAAHAAAGDPHTGYATDGDLTTHAADTSTHGFANGAALLDETAHDALDHTGLTGVGGTHPDLAAHDTLGLATQSEMDTHAADTTAIHGIADTSVLETTSGSAAKVAAHEADATTAHAASAVAFTPTGTIAATDVQAALAEVDTEKAATGHTHSGYVALSTVDAAGDLLVGTANDTVGRLAMGSALQVLRVNAGATALEFATPAAGGGSDMTFARMAFR